MLKMCYRVCFAIAFLVMRALNAQDIPINAELEKALKASGMSVKKFEEIMQNKMDGDGDLLQEKSNLKEFQIDKERIKSEVEREIQESIKLDPIINEIKSSKDNAEPISEKKSSDGIDKSNVEDEFLDKDLKEDLKAKKSQIVREVLTKEDERKQYFGYDIFQRDPEIFQKSISESVDPNYLVGPGDEIVIMLWGETEFNRQYIVTRDGYLFIPNIGQVFVNSLTLSKLEKKLFNLLKKVYSSLDPATGNPTTYFDISLGKLSRRPLRLFVLGDVDQPGAYSVKSSAGL